MTLLNPAALIFAVLVPVIILLYLLKLRRLPARVSTLMFWHRVAVDTRRRALFQRLRQLLSLLLHLLILALLILALARPELAAFRGGTEAGRSTVVVLDIRAGMQAKDATGSRFDAARRVAQGYLRRASTRDPVALLAAGHAPQVLAGFTGDEKSLLAALDRAQCTDAGGNLDSSVRLGAELLAARAGERHLVVLTDRAPAGAEGSFTEAPGRGIPPPEWRVVSAGGGRENVGITRLAARPLPNSPQTDEILLELENFGDSRRTCGVELSLDGRTFDVKPYVLAPGERRTDIYPALVTRTGLANARGWIRAKLVPADGIGDALALDDEAYAIAPPVRPLRVLLVTRGNWFLEGLFRADEQVEFNELTPDTFEARQAGGFDAVVLDDVLPEGFATVEQLPPGNFLFIRQAPLPLGATQTPPTLDRPIITDTDKDDPLLRLVDLRSISFVRAQSWKQPAGVGEWRLASPVRSLEHPLVITGEKIQAGAGAARAGNARLVALAFAPTDSVELPLRVAFPLFVHNAIAWLSGGEDPTGSGWPEAGSVRAGETVHLAVGETLWTLPQREFHALPGRIPPAETLAGPAVFQPLRNGFYLRRDAGGNARWFAVNTFDREVSAVGVPSSLATTDPQPVARVAPVPFSLIKSWSESARVWPPWIYLAVAALVICALEWWGFHRRRTE